MNNTGTNGKEENRNCHHVRCLKENNERQCLYIADFDNKNKSITDSLMVGTRHIQFSWEKDFKQEKRDSSFEKIENEKKEVLRKYELFEEDYVGEELEGDALYIFKRLIRKKKIQLSQSLLLFLKKIKAKIRKQRFIPRKHYSLRITPKGRLNSPDKTYDSLNVKLKDLNKRKRHSMNDAYSKRRPKEGSKRERYNRKKNKSSGSSNEEDNHNEGFKMKFTYIDNSFKSEKNYITNQINIYSSQDKNESDWKEDLQKSPMISKQKELLFDAEKKGKTNDLNNKIDSTEFAKLRDKIREELEETPKDNKEIAIKEDEKEDEKITEKDDDEKNVDKPFNKRYSMIDSTEIKKLQNNKKFMKKTKMNFSKRNSKQEMEYILIEGEEAPEEKRRKSDATSTLEIKKAMEKVSKSTTAFLNPKNIKIKRKSKKLENMSKILTFQTTKKLTTKKEDDNLFDRMFENAKKVDTVDKPGNTILDKNLVHCDQAV